MRKRFCVRLWILSQTRVDLTMKIENSDEEQIRIKGTRLPLNMIIVYQSINKGLVGHWINLMNKKLQLIPTSWCLE